MGISVAIVGSGPSGFYTADALVKSDVDCEVDIIERLPAPHGLIRYGVAPDHQTTKNVSRAFDKTSGDAAVRYWGNVEVGRDVSLDRLRELYDAVVLAVGSPFDRKLGIPGEDKLGVFGSAEFVGWYNAHPDFRNLNPNLDITGAAVIGVGNVAIDIARVLVKTREEMATSDIPDYALDPIQASPITDVYMFGRRSALDAKFTNVELREMGHLTNCHPVVDPAQLPDSVDDMENSRDKRLKERNLASLREFTTLDPAGKNRRCHFAFLASPLEILGGERVEGLLMERNEVVYGRAVGTGETFEIECGLVAAAIGYQGEPIEGAPFDSWSGTVVNEEGRVADGLYAVGWIKRGPTGVIGTNKVDGRDAAKQIVADIADGGKPGRAGLEQELRAASTRWVDYGQWQRIQAVEEESAPDPAPRRKLATVDEMLAVLG